MTDVPLADPSGPAFILAEQTIAASTALLCLLLMMFLSFIGKSYASLSLSASSIDELKSLKKTNRELALRLLSCPHDIVRAMALWRNLLLAVFAVAVLHLFHASTLTSNTFTDELCFVAASALLLFVFGYWIPWKMAERASLPLICRMAPLTAALLRAASPFLARIISEEEVQNYVEENNTLTAESVGDALKITEQQQDTEEADMLKSVLRFGEESDMTLALVYNVQGPRIETVGIYGTGDVKQQTLHTMDFVASYAVNRHVSLRLQVKDLLNSTVRFRQEIPETGEEVEVESFRPGTNAEIGFTYTF